jgi:pimeloyl-ACP methyl ester carboxylesterase
MQEKEIILHNKKVFYRQIGEGPVVVLLHGFGEEGSIWSQQFHAFSGFQLIIPDLPGSGRSEMTGDMSMEGLAETIYQLLEHLHVNNSIIIGHSMGGYAALAFAEKYPERLNGLGLFHSSAFADTEEKKETRKKGMAFIEQHGAFEFLKTTIPNLYSEQTKGGNPEMIRAQVQGAHNFSGAALVRYYASMIQRPDRTGVLKTITVPMLFILGKFDTAVPLSAGLQQCILPQLSYIHILESSGHMGMREEPDKANALLLNYFKRIHHHTQ